MVGQEAPEGSQSFRASMGPRVGSHDVTADRYDLVPFGSGAHGILIRFHGFSLVSSGPKKGLNLQSLEVP